MKWAQQHPVFLVGLVGMTLGLLFAISPVERQQEALAPTYDSAKLYFGAGASVGQSFVPLPGLHQVQIPVGRRGGAQGPLILHVRSEYFGPDIRAAVIFVPQTETENMVFQFEPLHHPPTQLIWVLEAPHDPSRAYWVYREQDAKALPDGTALDSGRELPGNFAFIQVGREPVYREWRLRFSNGVQVWEWQSVGLFFGAAAAWVVVGSVFWKKLRMSVTAWFTVLMIVTVIFHVYLAQRLPVIIDEGAYVQDAWQTTFTFLPLRDFLTKGPVYIVLLKIWQAVSPNTIAVWRLMPALAWGGVVWLSAALARRAGFTLQVQVLVAGLLALMPGVAATSTPLLLQVVSTFLVMVALVTLLKGIQAEKSLWVIGSGVVMAAAFLTRVSSLAAAGASLLVILLFAKQRLRTLAHYCLAGIVSLGVMAVMGLVIMGPAKTAVLFNLEAVVVGQIQSGGAAETEPVIRWITLASLVLWRGGTWILAGIVWLPLLWVKRLTGPTRWVVTALWLLVVGNAVWHLRDIGYGLPAPLLATRLFLLLVVFGLPLLWLIKSLWLRVPAKQNDFSWHWLFVCGVWLGMLIMIYRFWGVYRANYIVEFLPPATLLAAIALVYGLPPLMRGRFTQAAIVGLIATSWWQGFSLAMQYPISGTVTLEAAQNMAYLVARHVPENVTVFTAQPVITALSQRPIVRGYSHPGWIRAARLGGVPENLRKIYFADDEEITRWLKNEVRFVVTDERTSEIYFDDFPERQTILKEEFELIGEVPNDLTEEPFRLYERRDPIHSPGG